MPSSFNAVNFVLLVPDGLGGSTSIDVTPKWLDRNEWTRRGSVLKSITGRLALQQIDIKWKPVTLVFSQQEIPAALMSQTVLNAFLSALASNNATHTLVLEGTSKTVMFDHERGAIAYNEVTPTGEADAIQGRLYEATVFLLERLT